MLNEKVKITKGKFGSRLGRIVGFYMDGRLDIKVGREYVVISGKSVKFLK